MALLSNCIEYCVVDGEDRPVGPDDRGSVGFAYSAGEFDHLRERIAGKVPAVQLAVFAVDDHGLGKRVHCGSVDAPLADSPWKRGEIGIGSDAELGNDLFHHLSGRKDEISLGVVGIEDGDAIMPIAGVDAGVVVVLGHQQIRRGSVIASDHGCGDDGCGIVPAEASGSLLQREIAIEVKQPASVVMTGERALEYSVINVTV